MIGNAIEWYDFALYGFFVGILAAHFFPSHDPVTSIIASYGAFAAAFALRPIGALVLGHMGDRAGRKQALIWSLYLMALPTTLIGVLPTYAVIGIMAPILLMLLRFMQGFSMGGEFTSSMVFIAEHTEVHQRGFMSSFTMCSAIMGILIGSIVATITTSLLSEESFHEWGWRIPFLITFIGAAVGIYIRRNLSETQVFQRIQTAVQHEEQMPLKRLFTRYWHLILLTLSIDCIVGIGFFIVTTFVLTSFVQFQHFTMEQGLWMNTINMILLAILIPIFGHLSDRIKRQYVIMAGCLGLVCFSYPLFHLFSMGLAPAFFAQTVTVIFLAAIIGPVPALLIGLYPPAVRCTGLSFSHNLAMALFGGTAPMMAMYFIQQTGNLAIPGAYLAIAAAVSFIGVALTIRIQHVH